MAAVPGRLDQLDEEHVLAGSEEPPGQAGLQAGLSLLRVSIKGFPASDVFRLT